MTVRIPFKFLLTAAALAVGLMMAAPVATATPPTTYTADSTTNVYAKPSVTDGGAFDLEGTITGGTWTPKVAGHGANYIFTPTDFYCPIVRVTDPNTNSGKEGYSFDSIGSWMGMGWNADGTRFYISDYGSEQYVYNFDKALMKCTLVSNGSPSGGKYNGLSDWSFGNANLCYGRTDTNVVSWNFSSNPPTSTTIFSVASYVTGATEIYECRISDGTSQGGSNSLKIAAMTGGTGAQGTDYAIVYWNTGNSAYQVLNTVTGKIYNSTTGLTTNFTPNGFYLHQIAVSRDGRYVWLTNEAPPTSPAGPYIWDTTSETVTAMGGGASYRNGGHMCLGWAECINGVYDTANTFWWYRKIDSVTDIGSPANLVANVPSTFFSPNIYDDHTCWNNAYNGTSIPYMSTTIQSTGTYNNSPNYWSDEILGISTADRSGAGANTVWRFAHHRSTITAHVQPSPPVAGGIYDDYQANAWPNITEQGDFVLFTSNWEESLGTCTLKAGTVGGSPYYNFRDDVFIVKLTQSAH